MDLAARRREREPVAYLLGSKGFRTIELAVDARVLVPRPETEHVVEAALDLPAGARVADVGTGSGAIALALKTERPDLDMVATELSPGALAVARANAARLGLDVELLEGDLLDPVSGPLDAVVSNPPYVAGGDLLPRDVGHEPRAALFGGADGLDVIRRLVPPRPASPFLAMEVGAGQAAAVAELVRAEAGTVARPSATWPARAGRRRPRPARPDSAPSPLHRRRAGWPVSRRHGLWPRRAIPRRGGRRAALRAQGPAADPAERGDVLRRGARARLAARAGRAHARAARAAAARRA